MAGEGSQAGCGLAGCYAMAVMVIFCGALIVAFLGGGGESTALNNTAAQNGNLSSKVPPNFATLFKEAAAAFKIDPAIIAAIYLTEHHIDSFKKDISSVDATEKGCSSNSSGARGPMQIIDSTWANMVSPLKKAGISNPDRCKYRDAIYGAARYISKESDSYCKISKDGLSGWTDQCVKDIGHHYCGACTGTACGTNGYNYCDQTLKHYNIAKGSLAYLAPQLINDPERKICSAITNK